MTLGFIVAASVAGGTLSAGAAALALALRASWVPMLVSFAIGTLLGAAFLEILPHAFEHGEPHSVAAAILGGILAFFALEKLLLWRHCHAEDCEAHDRHAAPNDRGRAATLIVVGDTAHNFLDGVLIAAAFLQSTELGVVTALAIVAHEIPQEVGDFLILLHSGWSKAKALAANLASSFATLAGGVIGYFALPLFAGWEPAMLGFVAASMIYVAVADLIPGLHRRPELGATFAQIALIAAGIGSVLVAGALVGHSH
ncbi:MAG: ZIP family metal transporter [Burkholderiales bacterium]|nr:ZIP family metal transporter [Burkholderiales bacterium]